ncbi:MAG: 4-alpha-glucanotransferase, partial [Solirubrobacteraceae bacterium]
MNAAGRASGVQLHITSLPGGRLGAEAYRFLDWLAAAGQSWWQVLPLGPPDRYRSPYKSRSAFAAWPGLLAEPRARVSTDELISFRERQRFWIEEWESYAGRGAVADQVRFEREWAALRDYGAKRGVRIMGDVAIYVSPGSADHKAHPELFQSGLVAGAPPDTYAQDGQLWGNPLYDWPALQRRRYRWWVERIRRTAELFDLARIDHFRGFVAYWAVPAGARTAAGGRWRRGPGRAVFDAIHRELGPVALVAEDLGVITPAVERLRG